MSIKATPVLCAACGAALAYYSGAPFLCAALGLAAVSLMRVLAHEPPRLGRVYGFRAVRVLVLAFALGAALGLAAALAARSAEPRLGLADGIAALQGTLRADPQGFGPGRGGAGLLALKRASGPGGISASASGTLQVFIPAEAVPRVKGFGRGAEVYIEGAFQARADPALEPVFQARAVHVIRPAPALEGLRTRVRAGLVRRLGGFEWSGLAAALILGARDELEAPFAAAYRDAGCAHILALSGMHLTVLTACAAACLKRLLGVRPAAVLCSLCILLYVYLAGNLPSLNRAAIMYLLGVYAFPAGRTGRGAQVLALSFLLQLLLQPEAGRGLSFILSYVALAGIIFLGRDCAALLRSVVPGFAADPLAASLAAFAGSAAVSAACFGVLRPIGIIAGLVLAPLTAGFMLLSILCLAAPGAAPAAALVYQALALLSSLAARAPALPAAPAPALLGSLLFAALCLLSRPRLPAPPVRPPQANRPV